MLNLTFCILLISSFFLPQQTDFYVETVYVRSEYNAGYIFAHANFLTPPDKKISRRDVQCLVDTLKDSGLFRDIQTELVPTKTEDSDQLIITPTYIEGIDSVLISEIALERIPRVNKEEFKIELERRGLVVGMKFLQRPYREIEQSVVEAIDEIYKKKGIEEVDGQGFWINLKLINSTQLGITITSRIPRCNN